MIKKARLLLTGLSIVVLIASYGSIATAQAPEPVAGTKVLAIGVTVTQLTDVVKGWSVKKKILGHDAVQRQDGEGRQHRRSHPRSRQSLHVCDRRGGAWFSGDLTVMMWQSR